MGQSVFVQLQTAWLTGAVHLHKKNNPKYQKKRQNKFCREKMAGYKKKEIKFFYWASHTDKLWWLGDTMGYTAIKDTEPAHNDPNQ